MTKRLAISPPPSLKSKGNRMTQKANSDLGSKPGGVRESVPQLVVFQHFSECVRECISVFLKEDFKAHRGTAPASQFPSPFIRGHVVCEVPEFRKGFLSMFPRNLI